MFGNRFSSFGLPLTPAPDQRSAGRVAAAANLALPLNHGTVFTIDGDATIRQLPATNTSAPVTLMFTGSPLIASSAKLLLPNGDVLARPGTSMTLQPDRYGAWRCIGAMIGIGQPIVNLATGQSNIANTP